MNTGVDIQFALIRGVSRMARFLHVLRGRDARKRKVVSLFLSRTMKAEDYVEPPQVVRMAGE